MNLFKIKNLAQKCLIIMNHQNNSTAKWVMKNIQSNLNNLNHDC